MMDPFKPQTFQKRASAQSMQSSTDFSCKYCVQKGMKAVAPSWTGFAELPTALEQGVLFATVLVDAFRWTLLV